MLVVTNLRIFIKLIENNIQNFPSTKILFVTLITYTFNVHLHVHRLKLTKNILIFYNNIKNIYLLT